jgi:cytochrome c oxidase assembly protein subunit 11
MNDNKRLAFAIGSLIIGMVALTYAFVPLYSIFCKLTGLGGTLKQTRVSADRKGSRIIKVRFDANIDKNLPWEFKPLQQEVEVRTGENVLVFYSAKNNSDKAIIGTAVYNVTPHKAAIYFNKIECFCFEEQLLKPGQRMSMPVTFFIDPDIEEEANLKDVKTITLSYSFFKVKEKD